jgi:DNA-binding response OmpR family regulator
MPSPKILFVDDDNFLRKVYEAELKEKNFEVILASDGEEGLEKAQLEDPDLIILDMIMPKKSGFEVLTELQRNPKTRNIPVIILSNLGQEDDKKKGIDLGAVDYLIKDNITLGILVDKINQYLNSRTQSKQAKINSVKI